MNTAAHPPHSPHSVLAARERVAQQHLREKWAGPDLQRVLFTARQRFGHALCACRPQVLKLQIRLRDEKCHLAVWPQEGPLHDSECLFFHDELADQASPVGVLRTAAQPGVAQLPADAPVAPRLGLAYSPAASPAPTPAPAGEPTADPSPVNVKALAQRLWEAAALCRWHSSWTRDWGRTRYQLHQGAQEFTLNGLPLETLLFVPRPYREAAAHAMGREWDGFVRTLVVERPSQPRLLIAPLRRLNHPRDDRPPTVLLRHLRAPIGLSGPCYDFIWRTCRNSLSNSWLGDAESASRETSRGDTWARRPEVMGFFLIEASSRGGLRARAAWLLPVHPTTFIPAANSDMVQLLDQLVAGRYSFQHIPSDVAASRRIAPDLLVRHVRGPDGVPVARAALEVLSAGATADHLAARAAIAQRLAAHRVPTWVWSPVGHRPDRNVPPLPPLDQVTDVTAAEVLRRIEESLHADYRYGLSSKLFNHERKVS